MLCAFKNVITDALHIRRELESEPPTSTDAMMLLSELGKSR